jgi:hypothetical protein
MSFEQSVTDPLLTQKRNGTSNNPYLDIKELVTVINSQALLTEIPYKYNRVQIVEQVFGNGVVTDGIDGGAFTDPSNATISSTTTANNFYEIDSGSPEENQYIVDYVQGVMTFHPSQEGSKFEISYKGSGTHYFPASRVYTQNNGNGTVETLKDVVDNSSTTISNIQSSIDSAHTAANNANTATTNYQNLLNRQLLIYQPSVATFNDIATTYPTPSLGWTTVAKDTGIRYRYDSNSWVDIGNSTEGDGFTVVLNPTAPTNTNVLWVDVPSGTGNAKVVQSSTAPADTTVIWWQP